MDNRWPGDRQRLPTGDDRATASATNTRRLKATVTRVRDSNRTRITSARYAAADSASTGITPPTEQRHSGLLDETGPRHHQRCSAHVGRYLLADCIPA